MARNISKTTLEVLGFYDVEGADNAYFEDNGLVVIVIDDKKDYAAHGWEKAFATGKKIGLNNDEVHIGLRFMSEHYNVFGW